MSPRPLPKGTPYTIRSECDLRPELAQLVVRFLSGWASLDAARTHAVTCMMDADHVPVGAMLESLKGGRRNALIAAAQECLSGDDFRLYLKLDKAIEPIQKLRDKLVHHIWASSEHLPGEILLIAPKHVTQRVARNRAMKTAGLSVLLRELRTRRAGQYAQEARVYVYSSAEIEQQVRRLEPAQVCYFLLQTVATKADADQERDLLERLLKGPRSLQLPWA